MPPAAVMVSAFVAVASVWMALCVWASEGRLPGRAVWMTAGGGVIGAVGGLVTAVGVSATDPDWPAWLRGIGEQAVYGLLPIARAVLGAITAGVVGRAYSQPRPDDHEP